MPTPSTGAFTCAEEFRAAVMEFVVIIALAAPCTALTGYIEQRLMLAWRTYLTETLVAAYFSDRAFFNIKQAGEGQTGVDNPDQRVCDDVRAFVDSSVAIVVALVLKVFKVVAFAGEVNTIDIAAVMNDCTRLH
jgi:putative ATP-binding cassette transporter